MGEKPKLSKRHRLFVSEYLKSMNGTKAALAIGYSEKSARVQASNLLTNPNISAAIEEGLREKKDRNEINADWFVKRLVKIIDFNPADVIDFEKERIKPGKSLRQLDSISISSSDGMESNSRSLSIKKTDKLKAMELLMKLMGIGDGAAKDRGPSEDALAAKVLDALQRYQGKG